MKNHFISRVHLLVNPKRFCTNPFPHIVLRYWYIIYGVLIEYGFVSIPNPQWIELNYSFPVLWYPYMLGFCEKASYSKKYFRVLATSILSALLHTLSYATNCNDDSIKIHKMLSVWHMITIMEIIFVQLCPSGEMVW